MTTMSDNEAVELLPCPFCGAEAGARAGGPKLMVSDSGQGWTVRCTGCLSRASNNFVQSDAIRHWNTRIEASGLNKAIEALAPFATQARYCPAHISDVHIVIAGTPQPVTVGHLRRAATALAALRGQP